MAEANRILIINDEESLSRYLREKLILNGGHFVTIELNCRSGIESFKQNSFDIVIVKFGMPDMDGAEVVKALKQADSDSIVIALTEDVDADFSKEFTKLGIYDYINKPVNLEKLFFLIKKGAELRLLMLTHRKLSQGFKEQNASLQKQNSLLGKRIEESAKNLTRLYEDLRSTYMRTIRVLAHAIDARDHYTHSHSANVAKYAVIIAEEMHLSVEQIEVIREAGELHDLGKIGVEDSILTKPSALTEKEWESIKLHPTIGAQILEPLIFLEGVIDLIKQHHENYDGTGYPQGLKAEEIHLGARILRLADAYEAMTSARSYRKVPLTKEESTIEIKLNKGTQFDPKVVDAFLEVVDKFP